MNYAALLWCTLLWLAPPTAARWRWPVPRPPPGYPPLAAPGGGGARELDDAAATRLRPSTILLTPDGSAYTAPAPVNSLFTPSTVTPTSLSSSTPARTTTLPCDGCPDTDTRARTPNTQLYPFSAVGALTGFIPGTNRGITCSGALIGPRHVMTAAHCVWDRESNRGVAGLVFAPGQAGAGEAFETPLGSAPAAWARILSSYKRSGEYTVSAMAADVALVTLAKPAHRAAGWLAVPPAEAWQADGSTNLPPWGGPSAWNLTTAGYPSDKADPPPSADGLLPAGDVLAQWRVRCPGGALDPGFTAPFPECGGGACGPLLRHGCPSTTGQSGSPLWTIDNRVRGVLVGHVSLEVGGVDYPAGALNLGVRPSHPAVWATLAGWHAEDGVDLAAEPSGQQPRRRLVRVGWAVLDFNDAGTVAGLAVGSLVGCALVFACVGVGVARCVRRRSGKHPGVGLESGRQKDGAQGRPGVVQVQAVAGGGG